MQDYALLPLFNDLLPGVIYFELSETFCTAVLVTFLGCLPPLTLMQAGLHCLFQKLQKVLAQTMNLRHLFGQFLYVLYTEICKQDSENLNCLIRCTHVSWVLETWLGECVLRSQDPHISHDTGLKPNEP